MFCPVCAGYIVTSFLGVDLSRCKVWFLGQPLSHTWNVCLQSQFEWKEPWMFLTAPSITLLQTPMCYWGECLAQFGLNHNYTTLNRRYGIENKSCAVVVELYSQKTRQWQQFRNCMETEYLRTLRFQLFWQCLPPRDNLSNSQQACYRLCQQHAVT